MSDGDEIWTCSRCFPFCLQLSSFVVKGADVKKACTGGTCVSNTCVRDIYAENAFSTISANIKIIGPKVISIKSADTDSACIWGTLNAAAKYLEIHLHST